MNDSNHTRSSLFLTELIINVFFFFLLLSFSMRFFALANTKKIENHHLEIAVRNCENAADIFESGDGTFASLTEMYPQAKNTETSLTILFDADGNPCSDKPAAYEMTIIPEDSLHTCGYSGITITFGICGGEPVLQIPGSHYTPLTVSQEKGGQR